MLKELQVGMVGGLGWPHAQKMATTLNDSDPTHPKWREVFDKDGPPATQRVPRVRITHVWDPDSAKAEAMAEICGIEAVVSRPEEMIGEVDAVLLPDDTSCVHGRLAGPFLDAGLPTFVDKPIAETAAEAVEIVERAERGGAPLMTLSCLRYTDAMLDFMKAREALGEPQLVTAIGPDPQGRPLHYYGIHIAQVYVLMMGLGAVSVQDFGEHDHHIIRLTYADGRRGTIQLSHISPGYVAAGKFARGRRTFDVQMGDSFYRMLLDIVEMFRTGTPPVAADEMLEILRILNAAEASLVSGEAVSI